MHHVMFTLCTHRCPVQPQLHVDISVPIPSQRRWNVAFACRATSVRCDTHTSRDACVSLCVPLCDSVFLSLIPEECFPNRCLKEWVRRTADNTGNPWLATQRHTCSHKRTHKEGVRQRESLWAGAESRLPITTLIVKSTFLSLIINLLICVFVT